MRVVKKSTLRLMLVAICFISFGAVFFFFAGVFACRLMCGDFDANTFFIDAAAMCCTALGAILMFIEVCRLSTQLSKKKPAFDENTWQKLRQKP